MRTVLVLCSILTFSSAHLSYANLNLRFVEEFCLFVSIQADNDPALSGRSGELRQHLLRQALLYQAPVSDCTFGPSVTKPSLNIIVLAVARGYSILAQVMIDGFVLASTGIEQEQTLLVGDVTIYYDFRMTAGATTSYLDIRQNAQEVFENVILAWRQATRD